MVRIFFQMLAKLYRVEVILHNVKLHIKIFTCFTVLDSKFAGVVIYISICTATE